MTTAPALSRIQARNPGRTFTDLAAVPMTAFALTSTWGGLRAGPLMLCDAFLTLAALLLGMDAIATRTPIAAPRWAWIGTAAVAIVMATHVWLPSDAHYVFMRGQSEGAGGVVQSPIHQLVTGVQWLAAFFVLPVLAGLLGRRRQTYLHWMLWAWCAGAACSALVAFSDMLGLTQIGVNFVEMINTSGRQNGLQSHANNLGVGCAIAAPVAVHLLARTRIGGGVLLSALGMGVVASGSRGAQVGYVLAVALTVLLAGRDRRTTARLATLIGAAGLIMDLPAVRALWEPLLRFGQAGEASDVGRIAYRDQAILDIQTRPIDGIGIDYITASHSIYLQVLSAGGLILGVGFAAYFGGALRAARRLSGQQSPVVPVLAASIIVWLAVGVIENQLTDRYLYIPVAVLAALQVTAAAWRTPRPPQAEPRSPMLQPIGTQRAR